MTTHPMKNVSAILRRAAQIAIERGEGGGGWHIQEASIWLAEPINGYKALSLYHQLFDQSNEHEDIYFWFDNVEQVALALLFAAEVSEEEEQAVVSVQELMKEAA